MVIQVSLLAPLVQLYALYVIFHGHYSPGGGADTTAVEYRLDRLSAVGSARSLYRMPPGDSARAPRRRGEAADRGTRQRPPR